MVIKRLVLVVVIAVTASLMGIPVAQVAQAAPANGDWSFSGTLNSPTRTPTAVTVAAAGTASISSAVLQDIGCDDTVNAPPQGVIALRHTSNSSIVILSGSGTTLTSDVPTGVSASASVAPGGTYELVLQTRCGTGGSIRGTITPAAPLTITIASPVSTRSITRACIPTVPETPCTSSSAQVTHVPVGQSITFAGIIATTWSDGLVTEAPVTGSQSLQRFTSSWVTVATSCATTSTVNATEYYRCSSSSGGNHDQIWITAMQPTSNLTVGALTVTPVKALIGAVTRVQAPVLMNYSDGSQWPAPTSVTYRVEFQALNSTTWTTLSGPHSLDARGNVSRTFSFPGSGKLRVSAGGYFSPVTDIEEAVKTDEFSFADVRFPSTVEPTETLTASAIVTQKWTDGLSRNPEPGTPVSLEFALAYTPNAFDLTWVKVATSQTTSSTNTISVSSVPQASGYWRLTAGSSKSTASYVSVPGSRVVQVRSTMTPSPGSEPCAGTSSDYAVTVSIEGYVGTRDLTVSLDFGGITTTLGKVSRTSSLSGRFAVRAPRAPGQVTPVYVVTDELGIEWARTNGAPITVDGLVTFEPVLLQPDPVPLSGTSTTFVARMQGRSLLGPTREGVWLGPAQLQRLVNGQWTPVADAPSPSGPLATFSAPAIKGGEYRVLDSSSGVVTPTLVLRVLTPTGPQRVESVSVGSSRVEVGDSVTVSAEIEAAYDDGSFYAAPDGVAVRVLYQDEGREAVQVATATTVGGVAEVVLDPKFAGNVIFVVADGTRSQPTRVNVVRPNRFDVTWPKGVQPGKPLNVSYFVRASDGPRWRKPIVTLFQYQPYGSSRWTTVKKLTLDRGRVGRAQVRVPKAGTYRVYSPEFKFFNDARYG